MAVRYAVTGGTWSSTSTWNDGATLGIPTVGDNVYTNAFTVLVDTGFTVNSLNNVAKSVGSKATPNMTSNGAPSGQVISSNNSINAFRAFDGQNSFTSGWQGGAATGWVGYISNSPFIVTRYILQQFDIQTYGGGNANGPTSWNLEGSNDNITWNILHTASFLLITNQTYQSPLFSNTTSYSIYRINVLTSNGGTNVAIGEINLYVGDNAITTTAGGSFNFNTDNVTATLTSSNGFNNAGSTIINVTATGGTVELDTSSTAIYSNGFTILTHTDSCNFILRGVNFGHDGSSTIGISKSSSGKFTFFGSLVGGGTGSAGARTRQIVATNGDVDIIGTIFNSFGRGGGSGLNFQGTGNLSITGSVICNNATYSSNPSINSTSTGIITVSGDVISNTANNAISTSSRCIVNGNISGNTAASISTSNNLTVNGQVNGFLGIGVSTSGPITIVNGSVLGGTNVGISSTSANRIEVTGDVTASATANAISMTNTNGQVFLNGNMFNNAGKMAIYAPRIWLDRTGTTQARFFTFGGVDRTLYSEDTFPNLPPTSSVTLNTLYGPQNSLTGTMIVPSSSDTASGVNVGNTVGTALFSTQTLLDEIKNSNDPIALRLENCLTPEILGNILEAFNKR